MNIYIANRALWDYETTYRCFWAGFPKIYDDVTLENPPIDPATGLVTYSREQYNTMCDTIRNAYEIIGRSQLPKSDAEQVFAYIVSVDRTITKWHGIRDMAEQMDKDGIPHSTILRFIDGIRGPF